MKTSLKTLTTICAVVISLTANAQHRSRGNEGTVNHGNNTNTNNATASVDRHGHHGNNGHHYGNYNHNNWGGNYAGSGIHIQFGVFPFWGDGNGYNYYGNDYGTSIRRAARNSIRQSASVLGNALNYSDWNDAYSPWLAKAIRHQQYAKQLYFWGDYAGALNHAERAGYLAWTTLNYFNDGFGYNDGYNGGNYPNPYSDPNNPYYRKNSTTAPNTNNGSDNSDFGYRKNADNSQSTEKTNGTKNTKGELKSSDLDTTLPESKANDKELLKTSVKDLDVE